ncbi:MAG: hypothetical protein M5U09_28080 [Gammaproteobacteria bacterium]|nr:hypothetical protein [Gammaproteobacteria bacterium]
MVGLTRGWERVDVERVVQHPDRIHYFMPPWSGNDAEAELLIDFLVSIAPPHPLTGEPQSAH